MMKATDLKKCLPLCGMWSQYMFALWDVERIQDMELEEMEENFKRVYETVLDYISMFNIPWKEMGYPDSEEENLQSELEKAQDDNMAYEQKLILNNKVALGEFILDNEPYYR